MHRQAFVVNLGDTDFAIRINDLRKGRFSWDVQRHSNADYELHIILAGSCAVSVDEQQYALSAGEAILVSPGYYHQPTMTDNMFQKMTISFFPDSGRVAQAVKDIGMARVIKLSDAMQKLGCQILEDYGKNLPFQRDLTGAMLTQMMVYLLRKLAVPDRVAATEELNSWRTDIIDNFFSEELDYGTEAQLAQQLHLSRRQLSRVMQTYYGMNFRQKLLSARMDRAGWLLRTTDLTAAQIYSSVGYNSEAAFYQNFKAYYGMTPRQYRKKQKGRSKPDDKKPIMEE